MYSQATISPLPQAFGCHAGGRVVNQAKAAPEKGVFVLLIEQKHG